MDYRRHALVILALRRLFQTPNIICFLFLTVRRIPVMPEHARIASFKLVYFRFICFGVGLGGGWFVMLDLEACSTKYGK